MQVKLAFISAALATLVVATPTPRDDEPASSCTTGSLQCCNSLVSPGSIEGDVAISVLAISVEDPNVLFGLTCSPITSTAGSSCSSPRHAVCCENNDFNGLISIDCVPPPA